MIKNVNESTKKILSVIYQKQPISRKDIAIITGFSKAAVSYSIEQLINEGMVLEEGAANASKKGGPRPINLVINCEYAYVITFLARLNEPVIEVKSFNGTNVFTAEFSKLRYDSFDDMLSESLNLIKLCLEKYSQKTFLGIGLSIPGNVKHNKIINSPYFNVEKTDVIKILSDCTGLDVFAERDVYNMAYGERWKGCGKKYKDFFTIWAGTGIGSAIIINSQLVKGKNAFAGEMGFLATSKDAFASKPVSLNDFGYFESKTSVAILEKKYKKPFFEIVTMAQNDKDVLEDIHKICDSFVMGLANAIVLLNPSAIVINGRLRLAKNIIDEYIKEKLKYLCPIECQIEYSDLGVDAIILGGVYLVLNKKMDIEF